MLSLVLFSIVAFSRNLRLRAVGCLAGASARALPGEERVLRATARSMEAGHRGCDDEDLAKAAVRLHRACTGARRPFLRRASAAVLPRPTACLAFFFP